MVEPIETQSINDPPIVVVPIEAQNINDLPIVVEPIEVQCFNDLPIVVEPIETQSIKDDVKSVLRILSAHDKNNCWDTAVGILIK